MLRITSQNYEHDGAFPREETWFLGLRALYVELEAELHQFLAAQIVAKLVSNLYEYVSIVVSQKILFR